MLMNISSSKQMTIKIKRNLKILLSDLGYGCKSGKNFGQVKQAPNPKLSKLMMLSLH